VEKSCSHEIPGLGQEESSFDHACHSHSRRYDSVSHNRAALANARGLLGRDRDLGRHAIYSWRDGNLSIDRIVATAVGASIGALEINYFGANLVAFALGIILIGLLSIALRLEKSAYHYASITLAIIVLIPRSLSAWTVALHRFLEASVGMSFWCRPKTASATPRILVADTNG
jgi:hypothetical protein